MRERCGRSSSSNSSSRRSSSVITIITVTVIGWLWFLQAREVQHPLLTPLTALQPPSFNAIASFPLHPCHWPAVHLNPCSPPISSHISPSTDSLPHRQIQLLGFLFFFLLVLLLYRFFLFTYVFNFCFFFASASARSFDDAPVGRNSVVLVTPGKIWTQVKQEAQSLTSNGFRALTTSLALLFFHLGW